MSRIDPGTPEIVSTMRRVILVLVCLCVAPIVSYGWVINPSPGVGSSRRRYAGDAAKRPRPTTTARHDDSRPTRIQRLLLASPNDEEGGEDDGRDGGNSDRPVYDLGIGKNPAVDSSGAEVLAANWIAPEPVRKPLTPSQAAAAYSTAQQSLIANGDGVVVSSDQQQPQPPPYTRIRRMVARDNASQVLRGALWDELHYSSSPASANRDGDGFARRNERDRDGDDVLHEAASREVGPTYGFRAPPRPRAFYPNIDLSIPDSVYDEDGSVDLVWDLLRWEAFQQAQREPLLVSYLHSTILNHPSLESSLAFLLANRLQSPGMIATQLQSIIADALQNSPTFRRNLRADMMAVRDRDPACNYLPDVFLYFKGFHALQAHRVAHHLYHDAARKKTIVAKFLQSQVSQMFQIDVHPNAQLGSGIMLDHGTGIVIGETVTIGHNCSILHHVTLGGSGKKGVKRHPTVGDGVLLGAGATVLGPVTIGDGTQIGAGTLVISDLPPHSVAVGVPARIIGSFIDVTQQPSIGMDQMISPKNLITFESEGI